MRALEWAGVAGLDLFDHLRDAVRAEEGRAFFFLQLTHLLRDFGALVDQLQHLAVQAVNLIAQLQQFRAGLGFCAHGFLEKRSS